MQPERESKALDQRMQMLRRAKLHRGNVEALEDIQR